MSLVDNKQTPEDREKALAELEELDPNAADPESEDEEPAADDADDEEDGDPTDAAEGDDDAAAGEDDDEPEDGNENAPADAEGDGKDKKEKKPDQDPKEKFRRSTEEAQVLALRNKTYQEKIDAAENLEDPTDEQCRKEYGEAWDKRDEADKSILRQVLKDRQYKEIIRSARKDQQAAQESYEKANTFAVDPETVKQFPSLFGREDEFARFASKESRRGLDLEDIAAIFVTSRPVVKKAPKGSMMERSNASADKSKPVKKSVTAEQAGTLRKVDQRTYQKMIREGKINPAKMVD